VLPILGIALFFNAEPMCWLNIAPATRFYTDSILPSILAIILLWNNRPILVKCHARHTILYRFNIAVNIGNYSTLLQKANILVKCRSCHTILCRVHIAANIFYNWLIVAHNTYLYVGSILLPTLIFFFFNKA
jgi:hypothetical protein